MKNEKIASWKEFIIIGLIVLGILWLARNCAIDLIVNNAFVPDFPT